MIIGQVELVHAIPALYMKWVIDHLKLSKPKDLIWSAVFDLSIWVQWAPPCNVRC